MQTELIAGDTINYAASVSGYSAADGWSLRYRLTPRLAGGTPIDITATADGSSWLVQVGPSITADWVAGDYAWASWVQRTGERYTIGQGQMVIRPNPATLAAGTDTRSAATITLARLKAAYDDYIASGNFVVGEYEIGPRRMKYRKVEELLAAIAAAQRQVASEGVAARVAAGLPPRRQYVVRM